MQHLLLALFDQTKIKVLQLTAFMRFSNWWRVLIVFPSYITLLNLPAVSQLFLGVPLYLMEPISKMPLSQFIILFVLIVSLHSVPPHIRESLFTNSASSHIFGGKVCCQSYLLFLRTPNLSAQWCSHHFSTASLGASLTVCLLLSVVR